MILNLGSGRYPLARAVNLDLENGWDARDVRGLPFRGGTVDAVTISHFLMYLTLVEIRFLLEDLYRVTKPNAVVRVTEDDTKDGENVWPGTIALMSVDVVVRLLEESGFGNAIEVEPHKTGWVDDTLIQNWHGYPPKVFHVEGRRE